MTATTSNQRLDFLDSARAFALLLGIVFHAGLSFIPVFIGWAVMDVSTSPVVSVFTLVSHSFRMPLFFLMAGFFGHMVFHRKGAGAFIGSRLKRIAVPFAVGWFVLYPLIVSGWVMGGQSLAGNVDILGGLKAGFEKLELLPAGLWTGTHLWFLYYLLLAQAGVLVLRAICRATGAHAALARWADAALTRTVGSWIAWPVLVLPTAGCLWFMTHWGLDTPDRSLTPQLPTLLIYGGFFSFGWLLHRLPGRVERLAQITPGRVLMGAVAIGTAIVLAEFQHEIGHPSWLLARAGFVVSYALMMWSLVVLTLGVAKRLLDRPSPVVRYVSDASYWLYLVHLPIVVWLQVAVAEWPLHWSLKLVGVSIVTVGISLLAYDLLVRDTWIGAILNGRRKPRVMFRRQPLRNLIARSEVPSGS